MTAGPIRQTAEEKRWAAQRDVETLVSAELVTSDPKRMAAAKKESAIICKTSPIVLVYATMLHLSNCGIIIDQVEQSHQKRSQ